MDGSPLPAGTLMGEAVREATTPTAPIRVILADDSEPMRKRLRAHLATDPRLMVVGEAGDAPTAIALVDQECPDAVVLDLRMPGGGGIRVLEALRERDPAPAVVVVSNYVYEEYRDRCFELGAREVLDKSHAFDRVAETLTAQGHEPAPAGGAKVPDPYVTAVDVLDEPVALLDRNGTVRHVNLAWSAGGEAGVGRRFREVLRERSGECTPGLATAEVGIQDVLAGRSDAFTLSYPCQRSDASAWFRVRARRIGAKATSAVLLEHRNVTEVETMAQALRDSERRFRLLTENARDIVFRYRLVPMRGWEYVSSAVAAVTGYAPEEFYADPDMALRVVYAEDRDKFEAGMARPDESGLLVVRWVRKDGRVVWTEQQTVPARDATGRLVAVEGIIRDVTDRMDAQQAVAESEERLRMLFTCAPDVYILISVDGTIVDANQAAENVLGFHVPDVLGKSIRDLGALDADGLDRAEALIRQLTNGSRTGAPQELWVRRPDGRKVLLEVRGHPVRVAQQPLVLVIGRDVTQQHASEQAIRLQAAALESAANAVVITEPNGRIEWVNRAFTRLTGYLPEEVIGQTPRLLKSGVQDSAFYASLWQTVLGGRVWHGQLVNRRQDGSTYTEEMTITPVRSESGEITHLVAIKEDVSDRLVAEQALRESEARFRAVAESASDALLISDEEGRIVYWNRAAAKGFGHDEATRQELWLGDLIPSVGRDEHGHWISRAVGAGELRAGGRPMVVTGCRADGSTFPVELTLGSWRRGGRRYYSAILRDISDRKAAEAALRASEAQFRATFDHAAVGMAIATPDGRFLRVNPQFATMLGYTQDELVGRRFQELTEQTSLDEQLPLFEELVGGTRDAFRLEKRYISKTGALVWATVTVSAVRRPDGVVDHLVGVIEDVTQRRQLEQQLYQAQKMEAIGRLAGGVAHDFNNLLTIMRGESELALLDLPQDHAARESLTAIRQASDRAALLTGRLLALSRRQMVEATVFGLNDLVRDAERMLRRLLEAHITFSAVLHDELLPIRADRGQLEQVLLNLVVNARDAMPDGGELTIRTGFVVIDPETATREGTTPGRFAMLTVADTGLGMSDETQQHIFEPFFTTKPRGQGTGLGLATCFGIVKQAGGFLEVASTPGVGTTIAMYLPLAEPDAEGSVDTEGPAVRGGTEAILIVEDEDAVRRIACRILTGEGYRVLEAENGEAALAALAGDGGRVDLVLTDVIMPLLGGRDLAARVTAAWPHIRILYMSGYADDDVLQRSLEGDEARLIRKPFTRDTLLRRVRAALDDVKAG